jgi:hypothetical protein
MEKGALMEKTFPCNARITRGLDFSQEYLEIATKNRKWGIVKVLVDSGADINAQHGYFGTALYAAALNARGGGAAVRMRVTRGNTKTTQNPSPLTDDNSANMDPIQAVIKDIESLELEKYFTHIEVAAKRNVASSTFNATSRTTTISGMPWHSFSLPASPRRIIIVYL